MKERAARKVVEDQKDHDSHWRVIRFLSEKVVWTSETLRRRVRQVAAGVRRLTDTVEQRAAGG